MEGWAAEALAEAVGWADWEEVGCSPPAVPAAAAAKAKAAKAAAETAAVEGWADAETAAWAVAA